MKKNKNYQAQPKIQELREQAKEVAENIFTLFDTLKKLNRSLADLINGGDSS